MTLLVGTPWQQVLDAVCDPVLVSDEAGELLYANVEARALLGADVSGAVAALLSRSGATWRSRTLAYDGHKLEIHTATPPQPLAETSRLLLEHLEAGPVAEVLASSCARWVADVALVELRNHEGVLCTAAAGQRAHLLRDLEIDRARPHLGSEVFLTGQPTLVEDVRGEHLSRWSQDSAHEAALKALAPRSVLALPLLGGGEVLGAVVLLRTTARISEADRHLAEALADRAALAVSNALQYEQARRIVAQTERKVQVVVHDLRGPISACAMAAQHLVRALPPELEQAREMLKGIQSSALRAARLVGDLVRPEATARAPHTVDELFGQTISLLGPLVADAAPSLAVRPDPDLPRVLVDRSAFCEALGSLVGGALTHGRAGSTIEVTARREGDYVTIAVADAGPDLARASRLVEAQGSELVNEQRPQGGTVASFLVPIEAAPT